MENVILKELHAREALIAEHDSKVARVAELDEIVERKRVELEQAQLEADTLRIAVEREDVAVLQAEIDELKGYAVQLGLIEAPVVQEQIAIPEAVAEEKPVEVPATKPPIAF